MKKHGLFKSTLFVLLISICSLGLAKGRTLLVISELDHRGIKELAPLYEKLEFLAWTVPSTSVLLPQIYNKMDLLRDSSATIEGARDFIVKAVADAGTDQVDVILGVHGLPGRVAFYDGAADVADWTLLIKYSILKEVGPRGILKLGMLYNLSCYGSSHISAFRDLGFKVVIGSRGVNANAELEYPWVLDSMSKGNSVAQAFQKPNSKRWLDIADGPVRWLGRKQKNFLKDTDSFKDMDGNSNYRMY